MSIRIENLSKVFPDGKKALDNVSITFKKNKITGLIGFNGSGKTTTFNVLTNFIEKHGGNVTINDQPITREILTKFSYLAAGAEPKNPTKVRSHLRSIAFLYEVKKEDADKKIDSLAKRMDFTEFINKPIKSLSKGNQQKIKVISALLNPKMEYLLLDEPFDGLDPIMVEKIKAIFLELKGVTTILTSHRMDVVNAMCEEFFVLKEGILVDSRRTDDETIIIEVNKEVPVVEIKKLKTVMSVTTKNGKHTIIANDINAFKEINKKLIASPKYVYSSLKDKDVASSVFEGYGV